MPEANPPGPTIRELKTRIRRNKYRDESMVDCGRRRRRPMSATVRSHFETAVVAGDGRRRLRCVRVGQRDELEPTDRDWQQSRR